jgi:hypothetical protein
MKKNAAYAMSTPVVVWDSGKYATDLPAAIANAMGLPVTPFGDPAFYKGIFADWFA